MRRFFSNNNSAFRNLEERAKWTCVRFRNVELPPSCDPANSNVAFEIAEGDNTAKLLVENRVEYNGDDPTIREWVTTGVKHFPSFTALVEWIQGPLKQAFDARTAGEDDSATPQSPDQLTDIAVVQDGIKNIDKPLYLDETSLFERLKLQVLGQDDALKTMASAVAKHCARRKPARPAVIFAIGPSGVGKTRTAEVMAKALQELDNENKGYQFLRLDMTEYQEAHRLSQLLGAPQGYIGHGEGSQFGDALRANPRTIVLFDEIEKAHPAILKVLMNTMDAGRLSTASQSSNGREIDCRHAIFIFTSNLDAKTILEELESRSAFGNRAVEDEVCRRRLHATGIAPEIIGRIGRFLVYRHLTTEKRAEIIAISITEVAKEYGLNVAYIEPSVIVELMQTVRSQSFGVRPERFLIDDILGEAFAKTSQEGISGPVQVIGPPYKCGLYLNLKKKIKICKQFISDN